MNQVTLVKSPMISSYVYILFHIYIQRDTIDVIKGDNHSNDMLEQEI